MGTHSGWWLTYPAEKWWSSSLGMMKIPIYGKIKFMFQTTNQMCMYIYIYKYNIIYILCVCVIWLVVWHTAYESLSETRKGHPCCLLLGLSLAPICHYQVCFTEGKRMFLPCSKHVQMCVLSNGLNPSMGVSKMGNTTPNVNLIWQMNKSMNFGTLY